MGKMYKQAEWHLYNYQALKQKEARTRREIEDDAYYGSFGGGISTPVKTSVGESVTARSGTRLAETRGRELGDIEIMWLRAIENVWVTYTHEDEAAALLMERSFALTGRPIKNNARKGIVRDEVMAELHIDRIETYYERRRAIVWAVVDAALMMKSCIKTEKQKNPAQNRKTKVGVFVGEP